MNKNECKRFSKGSIFEDVDCMTCDDSYECNMIHNQERMKMINENCREECKSCYELDRCYYNGKQPKYYKVCFGTFSGIDECEYCNCSNNCFNKSKEVFYVKCKQDINIKSYSSKDNIFRSGCYYIMYRVGRDVYSNLDIKLFKDYLKSEIFYKYFDFQTIALLEFEVIRNTSHLNSGVPRIEFEKGKTYKFGKFIDSDFIYDLNTLSILFKYNEIPEEFKLVIDENK